MNFEQIVAPEKARNLGRVEIERNGRHKCLEKSGILHYLMFSSVQDSVEFERLVSLRIKLR